MDPIPKKKPITRKKFEEKVDLYMQGLFGGMGRELLLPLLNKVYQEAKDEFAEFIEDAEQFFNTVSEPGPPSTFAGLVKSHEELKSIAQLIYEDTEELLAGLTSSDTGQQRAAALESFNNNINLFQEKVEEIVAINTSG